jgi:hypothetical protein
VSTRYGLGFFAGKLQCLCSDRRGSQEQGRIVRASGDKLCNPPAQTLSAIAAGNGWELPPIPHVGDNYFWVYGCTVAISAVFYGILVAKLGTLWDIGGIARVVPPSAGECSRSCWMKWMRCCKRDNEATRRSRPLYSSARLNDDSRFVDRSIPACLRNIDSADAATAARRSRNVRARPWRVCNRRVDR